MLGQVGSGQVRSGQIRSDQIRSVKVRSDWVWSGLVGWSDKLRSGRIWSVRVGSGQVRSGRIGSGQVRSGQFNSGQVRIIASGQVKLGQVRFICMKQTWKSCLLSCYYLDYQQFDITKIYTEYYKIESSIQLNYQLIMVFLLHIIFRIMACIIRNKTIDWSIVIPALEENRKYWIFSIRV